MQPTEQEELVFYMLYILKMERWKYLVWKTRYKETIEKIKNTKAGNKSRHRKMNYLM